MVVLVADSAVVARQVVVASQSPSPSSTKKSTKVDEREGGYKEEVVSCRLLVRVPTKDH